MTYVVGGVPFSGEEFDATFSSPYSHDSNWVFDDEDTICPPELEGVTYGLYFWDEV